MAFHKMTLRSASDFVRANLRTALKAHFEYDDRGRNIEVYEAPIDAQDGEDCLKTSYFFIGTSTRYDYTTEEVATWDASWERTR